MSDKDVKELKKQIREDIKARGFKNRLSVNMVMRHPKDKVEPLVMQGLVDWELAKELEVSIATVNNLRRFYELPHANDVKKMLEVAQADDEKKVQRTGRVLQGLIEMDEFVDVVEQEVEQESEEEPVVKVLTKQEDIMRELDRETDEEVLKLGVDERGKVMNEVLAEVGGAFAVIDSEEGETLEPVMGRPLLDVETTGKLAAPLVNGVAKHLDRMENVGKVRVTVVVTVL